MRWPGCIRLADLRGYSYDRRDVTARALANAYAQTLGTIFTEQQKPYEVEICVAEVRAPAPTISSSTGSPTTARSWTSRGYLVMGGQADTLTTRSKRNYQAEAPLVDALKVAVDARSGRWAELMARTDHRRPSNSR